MRDANTSKQSSELDRYYTDRWKLHFICIQKAKYITKTVQKPYEPTTDLVRTSNKEEPRCQLLKEDNALAAEPSSQKDQNGSRGDCAPELRGLRHVAPVKSLVRHEVPHPIHVLAIS